MVERSQVEFSGRTTRSTGSPVESTPSLKSITRRANCRAGKNFLLYLFPVSTWPKVSHFLWQQGQKQERKQEQEQDFEGASGKLDMVYLKDSPASSGRISLARIAQSHAVAPCASRSSFAVHRLFPCPPPEWGPWT